MDENKFVNYMALFSGVIFGLLLLVLYFNPDYGNLIGEQVIIYMVILPILVTSGFLFLTGLIGILIRPLMRFHKKEIQQR